MKEEIPLTIPADLAERYKSAVAAGDPELDQILTSALDRQNHVLASTGVPGYGISVDECLLRLEKMCICFHRVAQQLMQRREARSTLEITDEYDVQDLFHALLMVDFLDIRKEEWIPNYAGGASRSDFLLKPQKTVIEIKKTREHLGAREVGEQLIVDIDKYKEHKYCSNIVCFVYDPDHRIVNPCGLQNDLSRVREGVDVRVFVFPKGL